MVWHPTCGQLWQAPLSLFCTSNSSNSSYLQCWGEVNYMQLYEEHVRTTCKTPAERHSLFQGYVAQDVEWSFISQKVSGLVEVSLGKLLNLFHWCVNSLDEQV